MVEGTPVDEMTSEMKQLVATEKCNFTETQAFEIVKQARAQLNDDEQDRARRKDTQPSKRTLADYAKKCQLIDYAIANNSKPLGPVLEQALSQYAPNKKSFTVMRAALKSRALSEVNLLLQSQDVIQRARHRGTEWFKAISELRTATNPPICPAQAS